MMPRRRAAALVAVGGCAATVLLAVLALIVPALDPHAGAFAGPLGLVLPHTGIAVWNAASGAAGVVLGLLVLTGPAPESRLRPPIVGVVVLLAAGIVGGTIAMAGYLVALALPLAVVAGLVASTRSHPFVGGAGLAAVGVLATLAVNRFDAGGLIGTVIAAFVARAPQFAALFAALAALGGWTLWLVLPDRDGHVPGLGRWALAHRRVITVAAALCALPYVVARLSWLTPWPLLSPGADALTAEPPARVLGLLLGAAMLAGCVLTLGLIARWGERFPAWVPVIAERPVPVALAVVPATTVATLFTAGGVDMAIEITSGGAEALDPVLGLLVLPFWLWGPLLGLATWAYALHRRSGDRKPTPA